MKKPNLTNIAYSARRTIKKYGPQILTGVGIGGFVTTVVLSVRATPKALKCIEEEKELKGEEELKPLEIVKVAWKPYVPAIGLGIASTVCLIGANSVSTRRTAALATAYKISETALAEYKEKVIETIGEKKEKEVRDKIAEKKIKDNPVSQNTVIITGRGHTLCYDAHSGRYFESDIEKIRKAENIINNKIRNDMYASLNELYDLLGLSHTEMGSKLGWNIDRLPTNYGLEFYFSSQLSENDEPCLIISYSEPPVYDYSTLAY